MRLVYSVVLLRWQCVFDCRYTLVLRVYLDCGPFCAAEYLWNYRNYSNQTRCGRGGMDLRASLVHSVMSMFTEVPRQMTGFPSVLHHLLSKLWLQRLDQCLDPPDGMPNLLRYTCTECVCYALKYTWSLVLNDCVTLLMWKT